MKFSYLLLASLFLALNGCSDFTSEANEFELGGKMYACDESVQGDIANDTKAGKILYCNGSRWIDLVPEDSIVQNVSNTQIMYECKSGTVVKFKNLCSEQPSDNLPLDDTEYPYAGIPRIVIETENHRAIKDRETEIPAKLQIWGESAPESFIMPLKIHGRGCTSWGMPKKSYKIELTQKENLLGMHPNKDWALIANYADKTLMRNHIMYSLSANLKANYSPHSKFVELYLNQNYLGVYTLTENIKVSKHRVNISTNDFSYLIEFDKDPSNGENYITSQTGKIFTIHYPKDPLDTSITWLRNHLNKFEKYLSNEPTPYKALSSWINIDDYIRHYWLQEFSNNRDGNFNRSVYFSISNKGPISMGPIWDFDLSFGNHGEEEIKSFKKWRIRNYYWNLHLFKDSSFLKRTTSFWKENHLLFESILDSIDYNKNYLHQAAQNNFKRWDILRDTSDWWKPKVYSSYEESVFDLKKWIKNRIEWINNQIL